MLGQIDFQLEACGVNLKIGLIHDKATYCSILKCLLI